MTPGPDSSAGQDPILDPALAPPQPNPRPRAIAYIDGFNLYYRALKGSPHRWLDIQALIVNKFPTKEIIKVKYFSAPTIRNGGGHSVPQQVYWRALRTLSLVEIHSGRFQINTASYPIADPAQLPRAVPLLDAHGLYQNQLVVKIEEKGTDVNFATHLLSDAYEDLFDEAIVVTNDSDLAMPLERIRAKLGKKVLAFHPTKNIAQGLLPYVDWKARIKPNELNAAQLPAIITDVNGTITKPTRW